MQADFLIRDAGFRIFFRRRRSGADRPLDLVCCLIRDTLKEMSYGFGRFRASEGSLPVSPEQLLRGPLRQVLYNIYWKKWLGEQLNCNLLDRWFVGLGPDHPMWNATTVSGTKSGRGKAKRSRSS